MTKLFSTEALELDPGITGVQILEYYTNEMLASKYPSHFASNGRSCFVCAVMAKTPFPLNQVRRQATVFSLKYNADKQEVYLIKKPLEMTKYPLPSGVIEVKAFATCSLYKIGDNKTGFNYSYVIDFGG